MDLGSLTMYTRTINERGKLFRDPCIRDRLGEKVTWISFPPMPAVCNKIDKNCQSDDHAL